MTARRRRANKTKNYNEEDDGEEDEASSPDIKSSRSTPRTRTTPKRTSSRRRYSNSGDDDGNSDDENYRSYARMSRESSASKRNLRHHTKISYAEMDDTEIDDEQEEEEVYEPETPEPVTKVISRARRNQKQETTNNQVNVVSSRPVRQRKTINYKDLDDGQVDKDDYTTVHNGKGAGRASLARKATLNSAAVDHEPQERSVEDIELEGEEEVEAETTTNRKRKPSNEEQYIQSNLDSQSPPKKRSRNMTDVSSTYQNGDTNGRILEQGTENGEEVPAEVDSSSTMAHTSEDAAVDTTRTEGEKSDQASQNIQSSNSNLLYDNMEDPILANVPSQSRAQEEDQVEHAEQETSSMEIEEAEEPEQPTRKKNTSDDEYEPDTAEGDNTQEREEEEGLEEPMEIDEEDEEPRVVRTRRTRHVTHRRSSHTSEDDEDDDEVHVMRNMRSNRSSRAQRYARRTQHVTFSEEEQENDDEEESSSEAPIKTRLRPRNKKQVNPYTHVPEVVTPTRQEKESNRYDRLQAQYSKERIQILRQTPPKPVPVEVQTPVLSDSSSSDSSDDEMPGQMNAAKSSLSSSSKYSHIAPINLNDLQGNKGKPSADIDPMKVGNVGWDQIGGLQHHVDALKEMVVLPLLYPEVFHKFDITPPRGVIFFGPPGTGKTLVARALANSCSNSARPIAFFMRKGADILSKWVGEAEKQLRLLFDEAKKLQPSIIFFDEIDGLAPVRSSKQDYIHSSIVSTLLALLDGLDNRGQVVVIGATNRIDSIDPALRRPGRFDRELIFTLPSKNARREIFGIHTRNWQPPVPPGLSEDIAKRCVGYCGADIKALCAEAALCSLKRKYPQVYSSNARLMIDINSVQVQKIDFLDAMKSITPASHRSAIVHSRPLPSHLAPLFVEKLQLIKDLIRKVFPISSKFLDRHDEIVPTGSTSDADTMTNEESANDEYTNFSEISYMDHEISDYLINPPSYRPWILLYGDEGMGQLTLARAVLYALEEMPLFSLDFASLITNQNVRSAEEALISTFAEARKSSPSVLWLPNINEWWMRSSEVLQSTLCSMLQDLPSSLNVLVIVTANNSRSLSHLPLPVQKLFYEHHFLVKAPTTEHRREMFSVFLTDVLRKPIVKHKKQNTQVYPELPLAPPPAPPVEESEQDEDKRKREEELAINELRIRLRDPMLQLLTNKRFEVFMKPPKPTHQQVGSDNEEPETSNLLYLYDILDNLEHNKYSTLKAFTRDLKQVIKDSALYQPNGDSYTAKKNFSKAKQIYEVMKSALQAIPKDIVKKCKVIAKRRELERKKKEVQTTANGEATTSTSVAEENNETNPIEIDTESNTTSSAMDISETESTATEEVVQESVSKDPVQESVPQDPVSPSVVTQEQSLEQNTAEPVSNNVPTEEPDTTQAPVVTTPVIEQQVVPEPEPESVVPDVNIDVDGLNSWFESFLTATEGCPVEQLDRHFSVLYKLLYRYRFTHERASLIAELEQYLEETQVIEQNT